ncbi:MAG: gliding motility-associated C-terminal domain-containing protein, partial [Saprospiraceae bacterium]|nr:gliding motility-associated C-terminal domain-containing protein [Saprospiraceae bacterium]
QWATIAGTYTGMFSSAQGCDSVHTVVLSVLQALQTQESRSICAGDSSLVFGNWETTAGTYAQTFQALGGCDSVHTVLLSVLPVLQTQESRSICAGDSSLIFGQWETMAGSYLQTAPSANGCDSTHTVILAVLPVLQTQENRGICAGDSSLIFGQWETAPGTYVQTIPAANGCDSTHTITLAVEQAFQTQESRSICAGDSSLIFGNWQTAAGPYAQTFVASGGCDSTHTIVLSVLPVLQTQESRSICAGDSSLIFGNWETVAGTYTQTVPALNGCDSTHTLVLDVWPLPAVLLEWTPPTCFGLADGSVEVPLAPAGLAYSLDGVQFQTENRFDGLGAGPYVLWIRDVQGCETVFSHSLPAPDPLLLSLPGDTSITTGQSVQLLPVVSNGSNLNYTWAPPDFLSCADCLSPLASPTGSITYTLTVQNSLGCTATDQILIRVTGPEIFIPNAFLPASGGPNSLFGVYAPATTVRQVLSLQIFDRWGGLVYSRENFAADGVTGWDGRWKGVDCAPGVYVYVLELELSDGTRWKQSGDVSLLR